MVEYLQIKTSQEPALIIKNQNYHYFAITQAVQTPQIFKGRSKPTCIRSQFAITIARIHLGERQYRSLSSKLIQRLHLCNWKQP